jgi:hypothetical protein
MGEEPLESSVVSALSVLQNHKSLSDLHDLRDKNHKNLGDLGGSWRLGGYVSRFTFYVLRFTWSSE